MGSEAPPAVTIHVTGFKKFHGVPENPTETIVSNLEEHVKKKGLPKGLTIGSCNILETAGQGALHTLYKTLQSSISDKDSESSNSGGVIWDKIDWLTAANPVCEGGKTGKGEISGSNRKAATS